MELRFVRRRSLPDGRVEEFTPKQVDGLYVLADRAVRPQHNLKLNQFFVREPEAVAARLRRGGVSLPMRGALTPQENHITARQIEIEEVAVGGEDDPFVTFTEWSEPEDEAAFRHL